MKLNIFSYVCISSWVNYSPILFFLVFLAIPKWLFVVFLSTGANSLSVICVEMCFLLLFVFEIYLYSNF